MKQSKLCTIASIALATVLATDMFLLYARERLRSEAAVYPTTEVWFPRSAAIPAGYLGNGLSYGPAVTKASCFALLYTSSNCDFCSAEMPDWRALVKRSEDLGCDALRIPTYRGAESPGNTEQAEGRQLVFLNPGWLTGSPPREIPALIIFARGAANAWCHVGQLDSGAAQSADEALAQSAESEPGVVSPSSAGSSGGNDSNREEGRLVCR